MVGFSDVAILHNHIGILIPIYKLLTTRANNTFEVIDNFIIGMTIDMQILHVFVDISILGKKEIRTRKLCRRKKCEFTYYLSACGTQHKVLHCSIRVYIEYYCCGYHW